MSVIWLPNWRTTAFNEGLDYTFPNSKNYYKPNAFDASCWTFKYQLCLPCEQTIHSYIENGIRYFSIDNGAGCNNVPAVNCPLVDKIGISGAKIAINESYVIFTDPSSFVNDTYLSYYFIGKFEHGSYTVLICDRTIKARQMANNVTFYWILSLIGILILICAFYILMSNLLYILYDKYTNVTSETTPLIN